MRFGPTPLDDAERAILAHGFRLPERVLKKGRRLTAADVAALRAAGYDSVVAARLDADDVPENEAARELAEALAGARSDVGPGAGSGSEAGVGAGGRTGAEPGAGSEAEASSGKAVRARSGAGAGAGAGVASGSGAEAGAGEGTGTGLVTGNAFTGRCNLLAAVRGVLCVDEEGIAAVNAVGEELTVATLPPHTVVDPRRLVATVKVIPFAVRRAHLDACLGWVRERGGIVRVAGFRPRSAGLVQTVLPGSKQALLDKTASVLRGKLTGIGAVLRAERRCAHTVGAVASALRALIAMDGCELVLVLGASAIVDRRDVVPAAIETAGGTVHRLGLPVDPGNLCLYAAVDGAPVLGLPGSSRSPAASGADRILERIGAGLPLTDREFAGWGAGGLLKEQLGRPSPRAAPVDAGAVAVPSAARVRGRVAAVVLAAGQSRRMGRRNKLLEPVAGEPMVRRAVGAAVTAVAAAASAARRRPADGREDRKEEVRPVERGQEERRRIRARVVVVTGHEREKVEAALAGFDVVFAHNPDYEAGLGSSLARGVAALPHGAAGAIVCLGDMPGVRAEHLERLRDAFDPEAGAAICVATHRGKRGNPVLFAARFFAEMCEVQGDVGARHLIGAYADLVREVEMPDDGVLLDVDSPSALRAYHAGAKRGGVAEGEGEDEGGCEGGCGSRRRRALPASGPAPAVGEGRPEPGRKRPPGPGGGSQPGPGSGSEREDG